MRPRTDTMGTELTVDTSGTGMSSREGSARHRKPPRARSKSDAAVVSHLLRHLPKGMRPRLEGVPPLTKPKAPERLMTPTARGKVIAANRDLEQYVAELERRQQNATHMRDMYDTLEAVQHVTGEERVHSKILLQEVRRGHVLLPSHPHHSRGSRATRVGGAHAVMSVVRPANRVS